MCKRICPHRNRPFPCVTAGSTSLDAKAPSSTLRPGRARKPDEVREWQRQDDTSEIRAMGRSDDESVCCESGGVRLISFVIAPGVFRRNQFCSDVKVVRFVTYPESTLGTWLRRGERIAAQPEHSRSIQGVMCEWSWGSLFSPYIRRPRKVSRSTKEQDISL